MSQPESGGAARPRRGSTPLAPAPPAIVVILDSQVEEIDEGTACALAPPPPAKRRKSGAAPSSAAVIDIITLDDSDEEGDAPRKGGGASRLAGKSPVADTAGGAARPGRGGGAPASQADDDVVCVGVVEPPASKQRAARDGVVDLTRDAADGVPLAGLSREQQRHIRELEKQLSEARKQNARLAAPGVTLPPHWVPHFGDCSLQLRELPLPHAASSAAEHSASGKRQAQRKAEAAEAAAVLARFSAGAGLSAGAVTKIWRVQHKKLYARYVERRTEVATEAAVCAGGAHAVVSLHSQTLTAPEMSSVVVVDVDAASSNGAGDVLHPCGPLLAQANERLLFHGADPHTIRLIISGGFECRVSNMSGALGAGAYFAENASYSHSYSSMPGHAALHPSAAQQARHHHRHVPSHHQHQHGHAPIIMDQATADAMAQLQPPSGDLLMIVARVALGRVGPSAHGARLAPAGFQSVGDAGAVVPQPGQKNSIYAVFDNQQAYPAYVLQYTSAHAVMSGPGAALLAGGLPPGMVMPPGWPPGGAMAPSGAAAAMAAMAGMTPSMLASLAARGTSRRGKKR